MKKRFRVLKIVLPEDYCQLELELKEFERLATKEEFSPIFENEEAVTFVDAENRIIYFAKKVKPRV